MEFLTNYERYKLTSYFVTLTYSPEHLPDGGNLDKKYIHQWIKDCQKRHTGPFRYYLVGEYGETTRRPHYHLAIFPEHPAQIRAIGTFWKRGFIQITEINTARARYLANYTAKKLTKRGDPKLEGLEPEFRSSSRNPPLGYDFVKKLAGAKNVKDWVEKTGDVPRTFRFEGKIYPIGSWALTQLRDLLDVPQTHKLRAQKHPDYLTYHPLEGAEYEPEENEIWEAQLNAKKKITFFRGEAQKV